MREPTTPGRRRTRARRSASSSDGVAVALPRPDPDQRLDRRDPDLPVTDLAGAGGLDDGGHELVDVVIGHDHVDAHLRHEVDRVLGAAVHLGVTTLPAEALHLGHREALHAQHLEGGLHVVQLERLDDCGDLLHARAPSLVVVAAAGTCWPAPARTPLARPSKSYADSPCSAKSMPSNSSSVVIRQPIVYLMTRPITVVSTPVQTTVNSTAIAW